MGHDSSVPTTKDQPASPRGMECSDMLAALERLGANMDTRISAVVSLFTRADPPSQRPGARTARG